MQATQTLIERGHDVVLMEKSDKLGGRLNDISKLPFQAGYAQLSAVGCRHYNGLRG
jgi:NADPH-dependent 2,4-dienoyl-CoA reductase/sulfur reductase-like enzyme